jgi:hypothetical protein
MPKNTHIVTFIEDYEEFAKHEWYYENCQTHVFDFQRSIRRREEPILKLLKEHGNLKVEYGLRVEQEE